MPLHLGKKSYSAAIDAAMKKDRIILVATKKEIDSPVETDEESQTEELYSIGTKARILQVLKMPDRTLRVLVEGQTRARITQVSTVDNYSVAQFSLIEDHDSLDKKSISLMKLLQDSFDEYTKISPGIPKEIRDMIRKAEFPDKLIDLVCGNSKIQIEQKIELLEIEEGHRRLEKTAQYLQTEIEFSHLQKKIKFKVKEKMEQKQKEYFLNEQIREINKELGRIPEEIDDMASLDQKLEAKNLPPEVYEKAKKELNRLNSLQPISPESGILRFYLEWIIDLPWNSRSEDNIDIALAKRILNEDHFGLEKPKERILDFIAVTQLNKRAKGPILCFTGPPGTGKTSLGRSVARALNRSFVRISLGGVRDEAEVRGHRKTYIGALPGKIIQSMKKAKTVNPVFLLDEIDKLNSDFRGDPSSALLEVLDPEQNSTFVDHYLELPYDLSQVMFIATANSVHKIPPALRDRMEVIELPGYTDIEKIQIAENFIIPKQLKENGLGWAEIHFTKNALSRITSDYTMESGVRNLERMVANIIRKTSRKVIEQGFASKSDEEKKANPFKTTITEKKIVHLLGKRMYSKDLLFKTNLPGNINGLAWTEAGGTLLPVEAITYDGKANLILTGNLGDVMKESAQTAFSYIKANREIFNLPKDFATEKDIHLHVPEGAIPKDGPSAGITMAAAIYSAFSQKIPNADFAMTGEITLTGKVLPIGGLKEKVLAAYRNKITNIILPDTNKMDLEDIPKEVRAKINFFFVETAQEVISILFNPNSGSQENSNGS